MYKNLGWFWSLTMKSHSGIFEGGACPLPTIFLMHKFFNKQTSIILKITFNKTSEYKYLPGSYSLEMVFHRLFL